MPNTWVQIKITKVISPHTNTKILKLQHYKITKKFEYVFKKTSEHLPRLQTFLRYTDHIIDDCGVLIGKSVVIAVRAVWLSDQFFLEQID